MKPSTNATAAATRAAASARFRQSNSPIPYLFGGLALMLSLIAIALIILACSCRKSSSRSQSDARDEKPVKPVNLEADEDPNVVVIMPGEDNPTFLAKPVSSKKRIKLSSMLQWILLYYIFSSTRFYFVEGFPDL